MGQHVLGQSLASRDLPRWSLNIPILTNNLLKRTFSIFFMSSTTSGIVEKGLAPTKQVFLLLLEPSVTTIFIFLAIFFSSRVSVFLSPVSEADCLDAAPEVASSPRTRLSSPVSQSRCNFPRHLGAGAMTFIRPRVGNSRGPGLTLSSPVTRAIKTYLEDQ